MRLRWGVVVRVAGLLAGLLAIVGIGSLWWASTERTWCDTERGRAVRVHGRLFEPAAGRSTVEIDFGPAEADELWTLIRGGSGRNTSKCQLYGAVTLEFDSGRSEEFNLGCCGIFGGSSRRYDGPAFEAMHARWVAAAKGR